MRYKCSEGAKLRLTADEDGCGHGPHTARLGPALQVPCGERSDLPESASGDIAAHRAVVSGLFPRQVQPLRNAGQVVMLGPALSASLQMRPHGALFLRREPPQQENAQQYPHMTRRAASTPHQGPITTRRALTPAVFSLLLRASSLAVTAYPAMLA
jgi:hypothetical protein